MDYGGVKGGREGAIAAMHELREAKAREGQEFNKEMEEGRDGKGGEMTMVEDVSRLESDVGRRGV
jgi:hypothetical protein